MKTSKNTNLNKEIINNFQYKPKYFIEIKEKLLRYEIGNRLIHNDENCIFTKSPVFNASLNYPHINKIKINLKPFKIVEMLQCFFEYNNNQYMFILETHYTLDNKPLFKTIKIIVQNNLVITKKINEDNSNQEFKDVLFIIKKRSDFPTDHHYNPQFLTKQWYIDESKPADCKTLILKKFFNNVTYEKENKKLTKNVKNIFSKDDLYSKFTSNSLSTLEKGFIQESETLLKGLIKKYKEISDKTTFIEENSTDYISILILFLRIHFKSDEIAVDNFFHTLDSICNDYSTFEDFCKKHVCKSMEYIIKEIFGRDFHIAIFETDNPVGFFLNEQWKIIGTNNTSTEIDFIVMPLSPKKAIIFSHDKDYIMKFDDKFEKFQKMYIINAMHEIIKSEQPLSLIYKNDENNSAENFIEITLNEPYPDYLNLPENYKNIPIIEIWKNNIYDINIVLDAISNSNKNIKYFQD